MKEEGTYAAQVMQCTQRRGHHRRRWVAQHNSQLIHHVRDAAGVAAVHRVQRHHGLLAHKLPVRACALDSHNANTTKQGDNERKHIGREDHSRDSEVKRALGE